MKIIFLGVGEAFDKDLPNNSHIIESDDTRILLDCGFSIPQQLWRLNEDPDFLDAIYISHQHGDHYLGLPALLLRMWEAGRTRDLTLICQKGFKKSFKYFMDISYKGFMKKFKYKINLIESKEVKTVKFQGLNLSFNKTVHSGDNLAIKVADAYGTIGYGGDGSPIDGTDFYKNLDLLILETYLYNKEIIGHSSIISAVSFAEKNNVKCLALTHINRDFRKNELSGIKDKIKSNKVKIIIPEPLEEYNL